MRRKQRRFNLKKKLRFVQLIEYIQSATESDNRYHIVAEESKRDFYAERLSDAGFMLALGRLEKIWELIQEAETYQLQILAKNGESENDSEK